MFAITETFVEESGFSVTPIEMDDEGFIFLPKELEEQLGYSNLSQTIRQSKSFVESIEYIILRGSKLKSIKELLNSVYTIDAVKTIYPQSSRSHSMVVLTEAGLYTAMILSRKANAQIFRRWITSEVLPSIRKTGMYKTPQAANENMELFKLSVKIDMLHKTIHNQHNIMKDFFKALMSQKHFQQNASEILERIEAALAESLAPNMFDSWKKINDLIDEMTNIYNLSPQDKQRYIKELCAIHNVYLPDLETYQGKNLSAQQMQVVDYVKKNGSITNKEYRDLFQVTDRVAWRELKNLVSIGLLKKQGQRRSSCYILACQ